MVRSRGPHVRRAARALVGAGATLVAGHSAGVFHGVQARVLFDLGGTLFSYAAREGMGKANVVVFERLGLDPAAPDLREARARVEANQSVLATIERWGRVGVEEARVMRVSRAYETLHQAAALMQRGGPEAQYYASLLACERGAP